MAQRQAVQFISMQPPLGQVVIHDRDKAVAMMTLDEMNEFVDDDILKALYGLFGEFKVYPNPTSIHVAATPLGFHPFDAPGSYLNP